MRGTSFTDRKRDRYLGGLRQGLRRGAAARAADTSPWTVNAYIKIHPEFKIEVEQAEIEACDKVEDALFQKAIAGHPTCIIFWLTNRSHERWQDRRGQNIPSTSTASTDDTLLKQILERLQQPTETTPSS